MIIGWIISHLLTIWTIVRVLIDNEGRKPGIKENPEISSLGG